MKRIAKSLLSLLALITLFSCAQERENWPQWRGPDANGIATPGNYPVNFSATDDALWTVALPGRGASTPAVWGDHIILTSVVGEGSDGEDGVLCYDWDGDLIWQTTIGPMRRGGRQPRGTPSNPSPVTDGERIFVFFHSSTVAALDFDGNVLWSKNLIEEYGEIYYFFDIGTSPVLVKDNVLIAVMHEGDSYLLALNQATGDVAWKVERNYTSGRETPQSYTTPIVIDENGRKTIVVWGADHLTGHDAATGEMIWEYGGFNPSQRAAWRTIASAVYYDGAVLVPYGRGMFTAAVRTGLTGNMDEEDFIWQISRVGSDVATPVITMGVAYILAFNGNLWGIDMESGEELWQTRLEGAVGTFYASPTMAGNKLYMVCDQGSFFVVEVSRESAEIVHQTKFEDNIVATPVLLRDRLIVRGTDYLYVFGE